jgi:uncharacterized protein with PQ loop repeat
MFSKNKIKNNGKFEPSKLPKFNTETLQESLPPKKDPEIKWKVGYGKFMLFWAVLSHSWLVIQAVDVYYNKDSRGISIPAFIFLIISGMIWFIYGAFAMTVRNNVIVVSSIVSFIVASVLLVGIIMYKDGPDEEDIVEDTTERVVSLNKMNGII